MDDFPVPQQMRGILLGCIEEAQRRGAITVGPEHLLLAIAAEADSAGAVVLKDFGLDHDTVDRAIDTEVAKSLAVVGIGDLDPTLLAATGRMTRPNWASSTRDVFRRAQLVPGNRGRRRRAAELDVLYGIVTASVGTVPRALEYAGVDRDALIGRVERERLAAEDDNPRATAHQGGTAQERQALRREAMKRAQEIRQDAMREAQAARRTASRQAQAVRREAQAGARGSGTGHGTGAARGTAPATGHGDVNDRSDRGETGDEIA